MRIIKKYPNRRLYDTEVSKYITLDDVKNLVLEGVTFCVKDVKSDEDLTRGILLQIISEQEHNGEPLLSTESLTQLIRFYGNAYQSVFSNFLEKSLEIFTTQQKDFQEKYSASATSPLDSIQKMTKKNIEMWQQMQDNFLKTSGVASVKKEKDS
ncbi:MAG: polyhydroxyalkanoate synthesis repressor PhaR [Gammaproteobacteria bacterium]|jgi:polyhydroxyalkanoate synthesis repressor PhaR